MAASSWSGGRPVQHRAVRPADGHVDIGRHAERAALGAPRRAPGRRARARCRRRSVQRRRRVVRPGDRPLDIDRQSPHAAPESQRDAAGRRDRPGGGGLQFERLAAERGALRPLPRAVDACRSDDDRARGRERDPARRWPRAGRPRGNPSATLSAELYDPASGRWTTTSRMTDYHGPAAVLLQDGRVLVAGGDDAGDVHSPATGTWTATRLRAYPLVGGLAVALLPQRTGPQCRRREAGKLHSQAVRQRAGRERRALHHIAPNRGECDRRCLRYGTGG